ncbi:MAG: phosphoribosylformylglycinamidine synthase, partial [bacterium]|nr:phosphoribosylformylglycinamidine synthase [bacterium]
GGLGVALAESAFSGGFGMALDLSGIDVANDAVALFSESQSRFVATVPADKASAFEAAMDGVSVTRLGEVTPDELFKIQGRTGAVHKAPIADLKEAWQRPLRW